MIMAKRDYYEILGLDKSASDDAIKRAYRKVAMKFHPDKNPGDAAAEEKFKEAAEAYSVLSDQEKKARYDRLGHAAFEAYGNQAGAYGGRGGMNVEDIFEQFGDVFGRGGSPFESFFGGGGGQSRGRGQRGNNLRIKVKLSLAEIAKGVTKKLKVNKRINCNSCHGSGAESSSSISTCSTCHGSGFVRQIRSTFLGQMQTTTSCPACNGSGQTITKKCKTCQGSGSMQGEEVIEVRVPAGVADGMQLSLMGKGNAGMQGGPPGDLLIQVEEEPHEHFSRDGNNLMYDLYLNFADAALGASMEIPTLESMARITIPAGTQSGKIFRLRDKGLPELQSNRMGDMLVHVNIWTPVNLSPDEKALLTKLRESPNFKPAPQKSEKGFFQRMREYFSGN